MHSKSRRKTEVCLGSILYNEGYITKEQLFSALEEQTGVPYFDLQDAEIPEEILPLS